MKIGKIFAILGVIAMSLVLIFGFTTGDFAQDGGELLANPWGVVSFVDLYVGFTLFSLWIIFREKNSLKSIIWVVLMMVLWFFTASLYVLIHLVRSNGDWLWFFLGSRKEDVLNKIVKGNN
ncbi:MAG: DUF1475 domain-containing protein [Anaerolineaceae bacterium]|nr:DUF1475 domain-containing protein [Anaerolineaceae bacterium]